jgi:hypothetical protein
VAAAHCVGTENRVNQEHDVGVTQEVDPADLAVDVVLVLLDTLVLVVSFELVDQVLVGEREDHVVNCECH